MFSAKQGNYYNVFWYDAVEPGTNKRLVEDIEGFSPLRQEDIFVLTIFKCQFNIRPSIYYSLIVKSSANPILEQTSTKQ